ncbi:hypothetical protein QOT17_000073 [Balamuthia mandrillaris]
MKYHGLKVWVELGVMALRIYTGSKSTRAKKLIPLQKLYSETFAIDWKQQPHSLQQIFDEQWEGGTSPSEKRRTAMCIQECVEESEHSKHFRQGPTEIEPSEIQVTFSFSVLILLSVVGVEGGGVPWYTAPHTICPDIHEVRNF